MEKDLLINYLELTENNPLKMREKLAVFRLENSTQSLVTEHVHSHTNTKSHTYSHTHTRTLTKTQVRPLITLIPCFQLLRMLPFEKGCNSRNVNVGCV